MKKRKDSPKAQDSPEAKDSPEAREDAKTEDPVAKALSGAAAATVLSVLALKDLDEQVDALVARLSEDEALATPPNKPKPKSKPKPKPKARKAADET